MKKVCLIFSAVVMIAMMLSSCGGGTSDEKGPTNEVTIGKQVWMTENLNVDQFRNGDPIPQAKTAEEWERAGQNKQPAWCYYDNDPANSSKYGKLYNWYAVIDSRGISPIGWHIPSDEEWSKLSENLGGKDIAGKKMKNKSGWEEGADTRLVPTNPGTNESGFSGLPGGMRINLGGDAVPLNPAVFVQVGESVYWWSSTDYNNDFSWYRYLPYYDSSIKSSYFEKESGMSVRCIKD